MNSTPLQELLTRQLGFKDSYIYLLHLESLIRFSIGYHSLLQPKLCTHAYDGYHGYHQPSYCKSDLAAGSLFLPSVQRGLQ